MFARRLRPLFLGLALLGAAWGARAVRAEGAGPAAPEAVERWFRELASPAERTRREAAAKLAEALPASRPALLGALPTAPPGVQLLLVEILVREGSVESVRAVLEAIEKAPPEVALRMRRLVVADPQASASVQAAWKADPSLRMGPHGKPSARTEALAALLRRAEAERLFLSRKSKSGATGSYHGQYAGLEPYRDEVLALAVGLITDREIPEPGLYPAGTFHFLRPLAQPLDMDELRSMAAHAVSELARPTDRDVLERLRAYLLELEMQVHRGEGRDDSVEFQELLGRYADLTVALYVVWPGLFQRELDELLVKLDPRARWSFGWRVLLGRTYRSVVLLRIHRYAEAVAEMEAALDEGDTDSVAATHYNLACAYAQWGEQLTGAARADKRREALRHLTLAVDARWSDVGWTEEDLDLQPIRDTPAYRALIERMRRANRVGADR